MNRADQIIADIGAQFVALRKDHESGKHPKGHPACPACFEAKNSGTKVSVSVATREGKP